MTAQPSFFSRYGPWALVTGASEGLGAAFARELARRGLNLLIVARRPDPLKAAAEEIARNYGVKVRPLALDVGKSQDMRELAEQARACEVGLLVLSAASAPVGEFLDLSREEHDLVIDTNCRATAFLAHEFGARMTERKRGGIVLVSSMAGFQGTALVAHYAASKAYIRVLAEGLWEEFRGRGVDVLACCAGITDTPTYRRSNPRVHPRLSPAPMDPENVAVETLAALGKRPVLIPGRANRIAGAIVQRFLSRKLAISMASASTRAMYAKKP